MKTVVIIGAGVTGLDIAQRLSEKGFKIIILEKSQKVGGMCASFKYKDFILDYGPHKFYTQLPEVYDEFKRIVGKEYVEVKKKNSLRLLGKYFEFPVKFTQLLKGISPFIAAKIARDISLNTAKNIFKKKKIITFEDYFIKGFGETGYNLLFGDYARKVWGNPKTLTEELARRRVPVGSIFDVVKNLIAPNKDVSAESFYYPTYGYGVIAEKLAKAIQKKGGKILFECSPKEIIVKDNKVQEIVYADKKGETFRLPCDIVVSSLSITELPALIRPKVSKQVIDASKKLSFRSLVISYVFLKKDRVLKDNWIFFPEKEFVFNRVAEQKSFSEKTGPKGKTVLTAEITCDFGDEMYNATDKELKEKIITDLEKAGLIQKEWVYDFITRRAGRVYPVYTLDYKEQLKTILTELDEIENLFTVGRLGLFNYNNADHCIDMGKVTAELIIENKPREDWKKARDYFDSYKIVD